MTKNTYCLEDVQRLVAWMAESRQYDLDAIVYAVEKPWKYWDDMPADQGE